MKNIKEQRALSSNVERMANEAEGGGGFWGRIFAYGIYRLLPLRLSSFESIIHSRHSTADALFPQKQTWVL